MDSAEWPGHYRPLHHIELNDASGTELYVSAVTGEVVRDTTRFERGWNYLGSVVHWIYPTSLRKDLALWDVVVWWVSLAALVGAATGLVLGLLRMRWRNRARLSPYRGMMWWHHLLGLGCAVFVLSYIFSGWLSMDHGLLFSRNAAQPEEINVLAGGEFDARRFNRLFLEQTRDVREIDFILLGNRPYWRARVSAEQQFIIDSDGRRVGEFFAAPLITSATRHLIPDTSCTPVVAVRDSDAYYVSPEVGNAPLYRTTCADTNASWFHIDGASGQIIEKVDNSRRWYRWLYSALHTLDTPWLTQHAWLRTSLVMAMCTLGFVFSITGVVIGWRRLNG